MFDSHTFFVDKEGLPIICPWRARGGARFGTRVPSFRGFLTRGVVGF
jgi:hypothetical protein